ncbi:unnamed protein product, partial [Rotaria sp. Silwood1]
VVALTNAAQTEIDTLSAGELILKQFRADYPHIKKLHKRTDNAGNFSSHGTPEAERVISIGNDLLNAHDIKEGMGYAGWIKNLNIAVAEVTPGAGTWNMK